VAEGEIRLDRSSVEGRLVDDELVIYDLRNGRYLGGNPAAAILWQELLEGTSLERLAKALQEAYGIDPDVASGDAARFVDSLRDQDLLER
jgi:hypothetical protein